MSGQDAMFPDLFTPRLIIRRLQPGDAERLYACRVNPDVGRFQNWAPTSVPEVAAFIDRLQTMPGLTQGEWLQLGIAMSESGELVGDCGLHARADDPRQVEIGITVAPAFQQRGFALEALTAILDHLFTRTETHRVFCSVDPRNHPCLRLLQKLGMRKEAHMLESLWIKGAWMDDVVFALLKKEWHHGRAPGPESSTPPPVPMRGIGA